MKVKELIDIINPYEPVVIYGEVKHPMRQAGTYKIDKAKTPFLRLHDAIFKEELMEEEIDFINSHMKTFRNESTISYTAIYLKNRKGCECRDN